MSVLFVRRAASPAARGEKALVLCAIVFSSLCFVATAQIAQQTATCTYTDPAPSAGLLGEITVSKDNNHFTLKCGDGAQTSPPDHTTSYCGGANATTKDCGVTMWKALFPKYESKWWSGKPDTGAKMTIPKDHFPSTPQSFYLGCIKNGNTCTVKILVEASALGAVVGKLWILAAVVGVAGGLRGIVSM